MGKALEKVVVSIQCMVYNHEPYLRQCLDGFVMQKTNFKFEAIVHDDVSTDGSVLIIREYAEKYPDIIKPIFETENQYSKRDGSIDRIMNEACRGKYIAICEGDDYWTDPYKLQKQVDFLEANPDYGMCYTQTQVYNQGKLQFEEVFGGPYEDFGNIITHNTIPTLTVMVKTDLLRQYVREITPSIYNWKMGDYPIWLWFAYNSKIKFINEVTSVYRVLRNSASHSPNIEHMINFAHSSIDIKKFFVLRYNIFDIDVEYQRMISHLHIVALYCNFNNYLKIWCEYLFKTPKYILKYKPYKYLLFFLFPFLKKRYRS